MTKSYPKYAQSEAPWIGEVPDHWEMKPTGSVLQLKRELVGKNSADFPLLSLTLRGVILRDLTENKGKFPAEFDTYQAVEPGDLVFCLFDVAETPRTVGLAHARGMITGAYDVFQPCAALDGRFMEYLYLSVDQPKALSYLYSGLRKVIRMPTFKSIKWPIPPLPEQRCIADYLDHETARIDTLIEEQQRLIEMLRDRRQAVIENAVFKGLVDVELRENHEPWLPLTPSHWTMAQLGFITDTLAGYAFPSDGFSSDTNHVRLVRGVNIKPGRMDWSDTVYWDLEDSPAGPEYSLSSGDLVLGMDRPFVSGGVRVASIADEDTPALLLQRVMRLRPTDGCDRSYLRYVVSTGAFLAYLEPLFTGVSVPHMSEWQVRKFKMPFPPLDEQRSIAAYLDEQTAKVDALIAETERFIELSRERRSALITVVVTGQIDVRQVA